MARWPSLKAVASDWPRAKVVVKRWQAESLCQNHARPSVVDIRLRTIARREARSIAACFSRRRMSLRLAVESGISGPGRWEFVGLRCSTSGRRRDGPRRSRRWLSWWFRCRIDRRDRLRDRCCRGNRQCGIRCSLSCSDSATGRGDRGEVARGFGQLLGDLGLLCCLLGLRFLGTDLGQCFRTPD